MTGGILAGFSANHQGIWYSLLNICAVSLIFLGGIVLASVWSISDRRYLIYQGEMDIGVVYKKIGVVRLPSNPDSITKELYLALVEYPDLGPRYIIFDCEPPEYFTVSLSHDHIGIRLSSLPSPSS